MDRALADRLIGMAARDLEVRTRLAADGSLFDGYHPEMEAVHRENAAALSDILDARGWPTAAVVGEEAAEAAWLIAQHAIGEPALQRRCLPLLHAAVARDEIPAWQAAYLEDRICVFEGRPQIYGTSMDWDEHGRFGLNPVVEPEMLDARRAAVGLPPRGEPKPYPNDKPPPDPAARRREMEAWARRVGWRA